MNGTKYALVCAVCAALWAAPALAQTAGRPDAPTQKANRLDIVRYEAEYSNVTVEPVRRDGRPGLAVVFHGTNDLHYYARAETAPTPGLQLKVEAQSAGIQFGPAVFPAWQTIRDPAGRKVEVYEGDFTVFLPLIESSPADASGEAPVAVRVTGVACTSKLCLPPFEKTLTTAVPLDEIGSWKAVSVEESKPLAQLEPASAASSASLSSAARYFPLAVLAGVSINVMPCVLPVLPLILMSLIGQAGRPKRQRIGSGLAFCAGVIFFFALLALVSAIINLTTGAVLDLNSLFRYPGAVIVLFLVIVFFAMVMLDVVTLTLPASIAGGQSAATRIAGSAGMGFFAAILSTPCSGALLGFVLAWAQTQPLPVGSTVIVLIGVGMALPYAVIVLVPSLLNRLPRPGHWMEIFKKSTGFLLLFIAVTLTLAALPKDWLLNVLTYGVIFSFCVWMWSKWTGVSTPAPRTWTIRLTALAIAVGAGFWLLPAPPATTIDWQPYDTGRIEQAISREQPVLLDFTADWCKNCKILDRWVFHDPAVVELIRQKNVLPIKADTTLNDYPATEDFKQLYGEAGNVPVSILLRPDGVQEKLRGIFDKEQLVRILKKLPEARVNGREEKLSQSVKGG
jgi:thiol:disulfide interchange protein